MRNPLSFALRPLVALLLACGAARAADPAPVSERSAQLVERLRKLRSRENDFGPAYQPLYHAALPWYELWGTRDRNPVDAYLVSPDDYAERLAGALETGHNFFAENPGALFPLVFRKTLPGGKEFDVNYWLSLPAGFPAAGRAFPLIIGLHGSGWLGHKISFKAGTGPGGATFGVTPIDMDGPWQIDFLNAYLDELLAILPVDPDRVYLEGHSLGAMATWEWALNNPERFAAISPRAGVGEPYRAARLKNVPAWAIHGESDDVIPYGFEEEMVSALQALGAPVRFSVLKGGEHNMPPDLDQQQVVDWYLRQTRSHLPTPPDPRAALGLGPSGFSGWDIVSRPESSAWKSEPLAKLEQVQIRDAAMGLFRRAHDRGEAVDSQLMLELEPGTGTTTMWLQVPRPLHAGPRDPAAAVLPAAHFVRFYGRGPILGAREHLQAIQADLAAHGHVPTGHLWLTPLSMWWTSPEAIYECRVQTN
jgi:hypothetical protein